jgi:hypothetical protein
MTLHDRPLPINQIETRRPQTADWASVTLGGTNLYARDKGVLRASIDRLQKSIETALAAHFCLIRPVLQNVVGRELAETIPDRVFGAVLGRALRFGTVRAVACLTINNNILRIYLLASRYPEFDKKVQASIALLKSQSAVSVLAVQSACFPSREWGSRYMAQQVMGYLALRGLAVFVDKDLFSWPRGIDDAIRANH